MHSNDVQCLSCVEICAISKLSKKNARWSCYHTYPNQRPSVTIWNLLAFLVDWDHFWWYLPHTAWSVAETPSSNSMDWTAFFRSYFGVLDDSANLKLFSSNSLEIIRCKTHKQSLYTLLLEFNRRFPNKIIAFTQSKFFFLVVFRLDWRLAKTLVANKYTAIRCKNTVNVHMSVVAAYALFRSISTVLVTTTVKKRIRFTWFSLKSIQNSIHIDEN